MSREEFNEQREYEHIRNLVPVIRNIQSEIDFHRKQSPINYNAISELKKDLQELDEDLKKSIERYKMLCPEDGAVLEDNFLKREPAPPKKKIPPGVLKIKAEVMDEIGCLYKDIIYEFKMGLDGYKAGLTETAQFCLKQYEDKYKKVEKVDVNLDKFFINMRDSQRAKRIKGRILQNVVLRKTGVKYNYHKLLDA